MERIVCFLVERRDGRFIRTETGDVVCETPFLLPPGAMWWWSHTLRREDVDPRPTPHLAVMTPAGLWCIDCPDADGGYWFRSGEVPTVTATPSVNVNHDEWHGWLRNGRLVR